MPASNAQSSVGTVLKRGNGASPEVFTDIGEVVDITPPNGEATEIDVTHLTSSAMEFKLSLRDEGTAEVTLNFIYNDAQQVALLSDWSAQTLRNFKIVLPSSTKTVAFSAYVKKFVLDTVSVNTSIKAKLTLRVSGAVVWS